jgi:hypothetical protein
LANTNAIRTIQLQEKFRDLSDQSEGHNTFPVETEMASPAVSAWMKQADHPICLGVDRRDVAPLVPIANRAGPGKVFRCGLPAMLHGDDMVWLVELPGVVFME